MPTPTRFWHAVEDLPGLAAVDAEWRSRLGDEYPVVQRYLRPGSGRASSFPRADGGTPYRVVVHGRDDVVGVCEESGERINLKDEDLLVRELDRTKLARDLSCAFGVKNPGRIEVVGPRCFFLGSVRAKSKTVALLLVLPAGPSDLLTASAAILGRRIEPFLLFTPTARFVPGELVLACRSAGSVIGHLDRIPFEMENGGWVGSAQSLIDELPYGGPVNNEKLLAPRERYVLGAMRNLEAFDSDNSRSAEKIAKEALGKVFDANSVKHVMRSLVGRKLVQAGRGRGAGYWLTAAGRERADHLVKCP